MLYAVHETDAVTATAFANWYQPNPAPVIAEAPVCDSEPRCHETQTELAHANRVAILGQLLPSIAHQINEPISAVVVNAQAALRLLSVQPTNIEAIRQALARIASDGMRAGDIVNRTRALIEKAPRRTESVEINAAIREAIGVTHSEFVMNGVSVQTKLAADLPLVQGDRVQLQQVMLNLFISALEPMNLHAARARDLLIRTVKTSSGGVLVAVQNCTPDVDPAKSRAHLRTALQHDGRWFGDRPVGLPGDRPGAWRKTVDDQARSPRHHFAIHPACGHRQRIVSRRSSAHRDFRGAHDATEALIR